MRQTIFTFLIGLFNLFKCNFKKIKKCELENNTTTICLLVFLFARWLLFLFFCFSDFLGAAQLMVLYEEALVPDSGYCFWVLQLLTVQRHAWQIDLCFLNYPKDLDTLSAYGLQLNWYAAYSVSSHLWWKEHLTLHRRKQYMCVGVFCIFRSKITWIL